MGGGIILLLLLRFGFNYWLSNNLPKLLKNNPNYEISYQTLHIEVTSGNIFATHLQIKSKHPEDLQHLRITGHVDTVQIGSLSIFQALFHKKILTSNLYLGHPNLEFGLPNSNSNPQHQKKKNFTLAFKNLKISNGNLKVYNPLQEPLGNAENLEVLIKDFELLPQKKEQSLPFTFSEYQISGENFSFKTEPSQVLFIKQLNTQENKLILTDFQYLPTITPTQLSSLPPDSRKMILIKAKTVELDSLKMEKKELSIQSLRIIDPMIKINQEEYAKQRSKKPFNYQLFCKNIGVTNAQILLVKDQDSLVSIHQLDLKVKKLEFNEDTKKEKIPFLYDDFELSAHQISSKNSTQKIQLQNLFFNPKTLKLENLIFDKNAKDKIHLNLGNLAVQLKKWSFDQQGLQLDLGKIEINQFLGKLQMNDQLSSKQNRTIIQFPLKAENLFINDASLDYRKNGKSIGFTQLFLKAQNLNLIKPEPTTPLQLAVDSYSCTAKNAVYKNLKVDATARLLKLNNLNKVAKTAQLLPTQIQASDIGLELAGQTTTTLQASLLNIRMKVSSLENNKLKAEVDEALVDHGDISILASPIKSNQKPKLAHGVIFPIKIKALFFKNSRFKYDKNKQPMVLGNINSYCKDLVISQNPNSHKIEVKPGTYGLTAGSLSVKNSVYNINSGLLKISPNHFEMHAFKLIPQVSRKQFIKMIPVEKDLYRLDINKINMNGNWDLLSEKRYLFASYLSVDGMNANIFRSKIPKDDPKIKPLYSELLRKVKFPLIINQLNINNSHLEYEEETEKSNGPGKLTFAQFNLQAKNLNSAKVKGKPTHVPIDITCKFFDIAPMHVNWNFNTANLNDAFQISGWISNLPANRINPFVTPYLHIKANGDIKLLKFNLHGDKKTIAGTMAMNHTHVKIDLLKKDGEKAKFLSSAANLLVKSNTGNQEKSATITGVQRDPTKSFFNLFWKGIEDGLKKILIGEKTLKEIASAKETVNDVKKTTQEIKTGVHKMKRDLREITGANSKTERRK